MDKKRTITLPYAKSVIEAYFLSHRNKKINNLVLLFAKEMDKKETITLSYFKSIIKAYFLSTFC